MKKFFVWLYLISFNVAIFAAGAWAWSVYTRASAPAPALLTVTDPDGNTCQVKPDPQGRKPLAEILGCPPVRGRR
jgi:hypothetical protein